MSTPDGLESVSASTEDHVHADRRTLADLLKPVSPLILYAIDFDIVVVRFRKRSAGRSLWDVLSPLNICLGNQILRTTPIISVTSSPRPGTYTMRHGDDHESIGQQRRATCGMDSDG